MIAFPRWAKALSLALSTHRALRSMDFDVVQGFGGVPSVDVHRPGGGAERAWLRQEIRCRRGKGARAWTVLCRTISAKLLVNLLLERLTYGRSPLPIIVANSRKVEEDLLKYHRLKPRRVEVIHNGVNLERFHPALRGKFRESIRRQWGLGAGKVMLFMAHNFRLKGLYPLLCALRKLGDLEGHWELIVVGRGRSDPYKRLARTLGILDHIRFVGAQASPESYYAACDLFVYPSFYDTFGNVCLEAMACGVPVLTTRCVGAHELIESGNDGWVVEDPEDVQSLAHALRRLLTEADLHQMGRKARVKAERFSWNVHADRVLEVYGRAMQLKGGSH